MWEVLKWLAVFAIALLVIIIGASYVLGTPNPLDTLF
jgi:hypothetical protein